MGLLDGVMFSKLTLTDEQLYSVGCVALESTYCEQFVESLIWKLCELEEAQGKFLTDQLRLKARLDLLSDIGKTKLNDEAQLAKFTGLVGALKDANEARNIVIHGVWTKPPISLQEIIRMNAHTMNQQQATAVKKRLRANPSIFPANRIEETARRISGLTLQLAEFAAAAWP